MNNISDNELLELCGSDDLSLVTLQEMINALGPRLSSQNPVCVHRACGNENVTLEIVQLLHNKWPGLLHNTWPGALQLRNDDGWLPLHFLCCNEALDETNSLDILRFMLSIDPTLPRELVGNGRPIHYAVANHKSTAFCKELIDAYPESLRIVGDGSLPIHLACTGNQDDAADTIQYMLEVDSELINAEDRHRRLPIHLAAMRGGTEAIELLLKFDPNAASKEVNNGTRWLPLHLTCKYNTNFSSIQVLYDAYPDAIFARDRNGRTPLATAQTEEGNQPAIKFLQTQLIYARQAQDMTAMTTLDDDGWLPLHRALKDNVSLGSIKLLMRANPATVQVSDQKGVYPLHIACEFSSVKVVKYLVELAGDTLNNVDANNNSPLHYACCGGNLCIVNYLLEANVTSVSERNNYNKLAIHLLLECGDNILDRESLEYVETVYQLLLANPEVVRNFMPHQLRQEEIATANAKIDANSKKRPWDSLFSTACEFALSTKRRYFG